MNHEGKTNRELLILTADRTARLEAFLFGNGQPGLITRMATVEEAVDNLEVPVASKTQMAARAGGVVGFASMVIVAVMESLRSTM